MSSFVLVHGSWHDGSSWSAVVRRLHSRGHIALAPTLAGCGKGAARQVTHAQSTQSLVDFVVARDLTDIVLVGHSFGGTIVSKAVEVIAERVRRWCFGAPLCSTTVNA